LQHVHSARHGPAARSGGPPRHRRRSRRVVRQVLTETLLLSLLGGAVGYLLASFLSQALSRWRAPMDFPVQFSVNPDWRVFLFALAGAILAGMLFGSAPAWRASRTDPNAALRGASATWGRSRLAFRDLLVVVQVALCFVLVSASFLSLRGLQQALKMNLGFQPEHVATATFELNLAGYFEERGRAFQQQVLQAIQQLPGVQSASYSNSVPLSIDQSHTGVFPPITQTCVFRPHRRHFLSGFSGFFATMGTKLLAARVHLAGRREVPAGRHCQPRFREACVARRRRRQAFSWWRYGSFRRSHWRRRRWQVWEPHGITGARRFLVNPAIL